MTTAFPKVCHEHSASDGASFLAEHWHGRYKLHPQTAWTGLQLLLYIFQGTASFTAVINKLSSLTWHVMSCYACCPVYGNRHHNKAAETAHDHSDGPNLSAKATVANMLSRETSLTAVCIVVTSATNMSLAKCQKSVVCI